MIVRKRQEVDRGCIVQPDDAARLAQACPDLTNWPRTWRADDSDIAIGEHIVDAITPFLLSLLQRNLAVKTFRRHRDNLWQVGGEIIRRRQDDPDLARKSVSHLIEQMIEQDGGPLIFPRITEAEQKSIDSTCSKLYRFLKEQENRL